MNLEQTLKLVDDLSKEKKELDNVKLVLQRLEQKNNISISCPGLVQHLNIRQYLTANQEAHIISLLKSYIANRKKCLEIEIMNGADQLNKTTKTAPTLQAKDLVFPVKCSNELLGFGLSSGFSVQDDFISPNITEGELNKNVPNLTKEDVAKFQKAIEKDCFVPESMKFKKDSIFSDDGKTIIGEKNPIVTEGFVGPMPEKPIKNSNNPFYKGE